MTWMRWIAIGACYFSWPYGVQAEAATAPASALQPLAALSDGEFALVRTQNGRRFWISKEHTSSSVKPKPIARLDDDVAFGRIRSSTLPAALKPLLGAKVLVHPASTSPKTCEVELKDWGVFAEFDSSEDEEEDDEKPKAAAQRLAAQFSSDSDAELRYAVDITEATRACKDAVWARLASLPPAPVFAVHKLDRTTLDKERQRVRKTALFREAQARYAKDAKGLWDKHPETEVAGWAADVGSVHFTITSLRHIDDCQSFNEDASFVFRDQELLKNELSSAFFPKLALDLNGDGIPEWLTEDRLIGGAGDTLETLLSVESHTYGCRC